MSKIKYTSTDGKTATIEVNSAVAELLADFEREDRNAARNKRRHNEISLDAMRGETGWEPADTAADIETVLIADEERQTLLAAVARLSDKQRRLVNLRYYEEKTEYEIAVLLGINQSNVHRQLNTIHNALKKILEKFDY